MQKDIYLLGIGNYTEVIIELALDCGYVIKGLYHYSNTRVGESVLGYQIIGCTDDLLNRKIDLKNKNFAVTVGSNKLRNKIASKLRVLGAKTPNLIHPKANVSKFATLGKGCFIHLNAYLWTGSIIGDDCVLSPNSFISHHTKVGNACFITPFSTIGTYCNVSNFLQMGINSLVLPKVTLGENCLVGAKTNVTKSFGSNHVLIGNPAKIVKKNI